MSIRALLAALLACASLAGCATVVTGHPSARGVVPARTSAPAGATSAAGRSALGRILETATTSTWIPASDATSGVGFQLPKRPSRSSQNSQGLDERLYTAEISGNEAVVSVGIIDVGSAAAASSALGSYADEIQAQFQAVGAPPDFAITEKKQCTYQGRDCQDMRIGFTPTSKPDESTLWLIRIVADGPELVLLQTIVGAPKSEQVADLALARTVQQRLDGSVSLT